MSLYNGYFAERFGLDPKGLYEEKCCGNEPYDSRFYCCVEGQLEPKDPEEGCTATPTQNKKKNPCICVPNKTEPQRIKELGRPIVYLGTKELRGFGKCIHIKTFKPCGLLKCETSHFYRWNNIKREWTLIKIKTTEC